MEPAGVVEHNKQSNNYNYTGAVVITRRRRGKRQDTSMARGMRQGASSVGFATHYYNNITHSAARAFGRGIVTRRWLAIAMHR